jgi:hypothetical protein
MIPYLLAIAGGYLIGDATKDKQLFASGGNINGYKIQLDSWDADVYEDSYEDGEGKHVNSFNDVVNKTFDSPESLFEYIHNKVLYKDLSLNDYVVSGDGRISTSILVDEENSPFISDTELEEWKKGNKQLYTANYGFNISLVNRKIPTEDELSSLLGVSFAKGGKVKNDFNQAVIKNEVDRMKSMMKSLYAYGGLDKDNSFLEKYKESLGRRMFNQVFNRYSKELINDYDVEYNVHTDSEGLSYNSLVKKQK